MMFSGLCNVHMDAAMKDMGMKFREVGREWRLPSLLYVVGRRPEGGGGVFC